MPQLLESDEHGQLTLNVEESATYVVQPEPDGRVVLHPASELDRHLASRPDLVARLELGLTQLANGEGVHREW